MDELRFSSLLESKHVEALDRLMFFNGHQSKFARTILESVRAHGTPKIVERNGGLRIELPKFDTQTLYALLGDGDATTLVGAVVYTRVPSDTLDVMHIAVKEEYTFGRAHADMNVAARLIEELVRVGRQIRDVHFVQLAYGRGKLIVRRVAP